MINDKSQMINGLRLEGLMFLVVNLVWARSLCLAIYALFIVICHLITIAKVRHFFRTTKFQRVIRVDFQQVGFFLNLKSYFSCTLPIVLVLASHSLIEAHLLCFYIPHLNLFRDMMYRFRVKKRWQWQLQFDFPQVEIPQFLIINYHGDSSKTHS